MENQNNNEVFNIDEKLAKAIVNKQFYYLGSIKYNHVSKYRDYVANAYSFRSFIRTYLFFI